MSKKTLLDAYRFPGFHPGKIIKGRFGDPKAFVITLNRRSKKRFAQVVVGKNPVFTIARSSKHGIFPPVAAVFTSSLRCAVWNVNGAGQ